MACKDIISLAGTKIYICPDTPATYSQAGYEALSFTEILEVVSIPAYGKSYSLITVNSLSSRGTCKKKGSFNMGSGVIELSNWTADLGQKILQAAVSLDNAQSFKIEFQDGAIDYLTGLVMGSPRNGGTSEVIDSRTTAIEWVEDVITTDGSPAAPIALVANNDTASGVTLGSIATIDVLENDTGTIDASTVEIT